MDCIDKFGYIILPITKFNIALERSAVDAMPVVLGKWENNGSDVWECSECGYGIMPWNAGINYCPNCGAHMIKYNGDYKNE